MSRMQLIPHVSEKTYALSEDKNTYVFFIPRTANKRQVTDEVERQFKVEVESVNIINAKGKPKAAFMTARRSGYGKRKDRKKAYVKLVEGDSIDLFEEAA